MDTTRARWEIWARMRDFAGWTSFRGETPLPTHPRPTELELEANIESVAAFVRERFPIVQEVDPGAWNTGGFKRVQLDEALSVLNLKGLE